MCHLRTDKESDNVLADNPPKCLMSGKKLLYWFQTHIVKVFKDFLWGSSYMPQRKGFVICEDWMCQLPG